MIGDNGRLQYIGFCLFEMYVSVVFVIRCLFSAMSLTLVREQRYIRIIYYYHYYAWIGGGGGGGVEARGEGETEVISVLKLLVC